MNIFKIFYHGIKKFIFFILETIKTIFINGFLTLLPITLTVAIFSFTWKIISNWIEPLEKIRPAFLDKIPYSEMILVLLIIFITGTILKLFVLRSVIHYFESVLEKIPLVRNVYSGIKQLVIAFGAQDKASFKEVVIVEFPRKGIYSIGFLTSKLPQELSPNKEVDFCNVYVPTTPNPTTGYLIIVPCDNIQKINLTRQEAMALIISGGIIKPDRLKI